MSDETLRLQLHDFSGHPFQAQLSRELARRGHAVEHVSSTQYASGKGRLEVQAGDPPTLQFTGLTAGRAFDKYHPLRRLRFELSYASAWIDRLRDDPPDVVVVCNMPLVTLTRFRRYARRAHLPWVLWHQDIYSVAMAEELSKKLPGPLARLGAWLVGRLERSAVRAAGRVVAIGDGFTEYYRTRWNLRRPGVDVISNWAPVDEIVPQPRGNAWAERHAPQDAELTLVYAGTLGRKHNPELLVRLVELARSDGTDVRMVVVSEGEGADIVRTTSANFPPGVVTVLPFQPAEELPSVLATGHVLVAILEPAASTFSIPSKVLSYLAAGRAILGLMPADNPAAADIVGVGGLVAEPTAEGVRSAAAWVAGIAQMHDELAEIGRRSRDLAEERFGIVPIGDRFEAIFASAANQNPREMARVTHGTGIG